MKKACGLTCKGWYAICGGHFEKSTTTRWACGFFTTSPLGSSCSEDAVSQPTTIPELSGYPLEIEPARLQFMEQTFHDLLGGHLGSRFDRRRNEILRWMHRRLFVEGATIATVRRELNEQASRTRVLGVTSGKGGVGKTTFAVNLAVAFAQQGQRTLLFDADLGMANVHIFSGINPPKTLLDVIDRRANLEDIVTPGPAGIDVICGASGVGRLADISPPVMEALGRELLRVAVKFDVLVMDTGAGIASSVMHFLGMAQDVVVISTPNLAATLDAYGMIKLASENHLSARMHLLINQADDESQAARVTERVVGCAERFLKISPTRLGFLFRDQAVEQANQCRNPLLVAQPDHVNSRRIAAIAAGLVGARTENAPADIAVQRATAAA
jgi:flagellar biosynthesis protein FlhG